MSTKVIYVVEYENTTGPDADGVSAQELEGWMNDCHGITWQRIEGLHVALNDEKPARVPIPSRVAGSRRDGKPVYEVTMRVRDLTKEFKEPRGQMGRVDPFEHTELAIHLSLECLAHDEHIHSLLHTITRDGYVALRSCSM